MIVDLGLKVSKNKVIIKEYLDNVRDKLESTSLISNYSYNYIDTDKENNYLLIRFDMFYMKDLLFWLGFVIAFIGLLISSNLVSIIGAGFILIDMFLPFIIKNMIYLGMKRNIKKEIIKQLDDEEVYNLMYFLLKNN